MISDIHISLTKAFQKIPILSQLHAASTTVLTKESRRTLSGRSTELLVIEMLHGDQGEVIVNGI